MNRIVLFLGIMAAGAGARVIVVPDSAATIAEGLGMARTGDTVLVKPGRYEENITWPSTDGIKLYSAAGPDSTVISGGGNGRVITMGSGLTRATEIRGFEISGGKASSAAGIYCPGSPSIVGNRIRGNEAHGERNYGGGILCGSYSSPLIAGNEISANVCSDTNTWNYGGGIYLDMNSTAEICYNLIAANICAEGYWNYGAGIYVTGSAGAVIWQNVIRGNLNTGGSSGRGYGAGIHVDSRALIFSNLIIGNVNSATAWNYGGGVFCAGFTELYSNTISANVCQGGNWRYGGGVAVYVNDTAVAKNNIVVGNSSGSGGGFWRYDNTSTVLVNSFNDVWNNIGGNYSNCSPGLGDISQDPVFASGPLGEYCLSHVAAGQPVISPCVDAGDTVLTVWPLNLDSLLHSWTTRTDSVFDLGVVDMGYHYPTGYPVAIAESPPAAAGERTRATVVHGTLRLSLSPAADGRRQELLDASGRKVMEVGPGPNDISRLSPGVYFVPAAEPRRVVKF
ncbi:MAG: hypothetical protein ABIK86_05910 [candidate division WOR-3 bacterium]